MKKKILILGLATLLSMMTVNAEPHHDHCGGAHHPDRGYGMRAPHHHHSSFGIGLNLFSGYPRRGYWSPYIYNYPIGGYYPIYDPYYIDITPTIMMNFRL